MKQISPFFLLTFLILTHVLFAQNKPNRFEYIGYLSIGKHTQVSYRLTFEQDKKRIKGFSTTDIGGKNETKSYIFGYYNPKSKIFNFYEKGMVYTKSDAPIDDFCYVTFNGRMDFSNEKKTIRGNFIGRFEDGKACINGKIMLRNQKYIKSQLDKLTKALQSSDEINDSIKKVISEKKPLEKLKETKLINGENIKINATNKHIVIQLWDEGIEDNDIVNIYLNDKIIYPNQVITNEKKEIIFELEQGLNEIKVEAVNEGRRKPNTATISVKINEQLHTLKSQLNKNEVAKITFLK